MKRLRIPLPLVFFDPSLHYQLRIGQFEPLYGGPCPRFRARSPPLSHGSVVYCLLIPAKECLDNDPMNDLQISRSITPSHIFEIAKFLRHSFRRPIPFGRYKAKVNLGLLDAINHRPLGRYVLVTADQSDSSRGGQDDDVYRARHGVCRLASRAVTLRQPSLGPVFGIKGGGTGGGRAQVVPMEDINLHFDRRCPCGLLESQSLVRVSSTITCFMGMDSPGSDIRLLGPVTGRERSGITAISVERRRAGRHGSVCDH